MIKTAFSSMRPSWQMIITDKINFTLALIPIIIGGFSYYFFGTWMYSTLMEKGKAFINSYIAQEGWGSFFYYFIAAILTIILFFIINWTFVLFVSLIASPFNDLLSARIEKKMNNIPQDNFSDMSQKFFNKILFTFINEFKKILFIIFLTIFSLIFAYIPFLVPIGALISVLLLAVTYVDYSWIRHDIIFKDCLKDIWRNIFSYSIAGGFFFILVSIPVVNLVVPALATSYFTILWMKNNGHCH
jgi:CysZ protein